MLQEIIARRFIYHVTANDTSETLWLYKYSTQTTTRHHVDPLPPLISFTELATFSGKQPAGSAGSAESCNQITTSPDNRVCTATTTSIGVDFLDFNTYIYNTDTGASMALVNELSFGFLNKTNTVSPAYSAYISSYLAQHPGDTQAMADVAADNFKVEVNQQGDFQQLGGVIWTSNTTFMLTFLCPIRCTLLGWAGSDTFTVEFNTAGAVTTANAAGLSPASRQPDVCALNASGEVTDNGQIVVVPKRPIHPPHIAGNPIKADLVAGWAPLI